MAVSYASITGRVTFPGSDTGLPGLVTAVPLTRAAGLVITGDRLTQGVVSAPVDADGNLPVGGLKVPIVSVSGTPVLWRLVFEPASVTARSEIGNKGLLPWQFYIGPITASATVQALATTEPTAILANFPASALAQAGAALASTESARDQALAAAAAATQLATSDGQTAANVAGGSLTKAALSASIAVAVEPVSDAVDAEATSRAAALAAEVTRANGAYATPSSVVPIAQTAAATYLGAQPGVEAAAASAVAAKVDGLTLARAEALHTSQLTQNQDEWPFAAVYADTREVAFGMRTDRTFYPPAQVEVDVSQLRQPLDVSTGWRWAVTYASTGEVAIGQRIDGSYYPSAAGSSGSSGATVVIEGDSLTAGWGQFGTTALGVLLSRTVIARGEGGQGSQYIAAKQGGQPFRVTVTAGTIPASTAATAVTIAYPVSTTIAMPSARTFAGVLAGVPGTLAITADGAGTFAALNAPPRPVPVAAGTPFLTGSIDRNALPILWAGRNNYGAGSAQVVSDTKAMLAWFRNPTDALVLSILPDSAQTLGTPARATLDAANAALRDAFPTRFEDIATRLQSTALITAAGGTPTGQDATDIANGITPTSLRAAGDGLHLGALGYAALNLLIVDIFTSRGL